MPARHELKTLPVYFAAVAREDKTFDVRKNDRDFQTGDTLVLKEYGPPTKINYAPGDYSRADLVERAAGYTGAELVVLVTYVLHGGDVAGIDTGYVVLGIARPDGGEGVDLTQRRAIPPGVYWCNGRLDFIDAKTNIGMDKDFFRSWYSEYARFPGHP